MIQHSPEGHPERAGELLDLIESSLDRKRYHEQHWTGSFEQYLDIALGNPNVVRNAYQRVYDMIQSFGTERYRRFKKDMRPLPLLQRPVRQRAPTASSGSTSR
jgi:serine protein kinase